MNFFISSGDRMQAEALRDALWKRGHQVSTEFDIDERDGDLQDLIETVGYADAVAILDTMGRTDAFTMGVALSQSTPVAIPNRVMNSCPPHPLVSLFGTTDVTGMATHLEKIAAQN